MFEEWCPTVPVGSSFIASAVLWAISVSALTSCVTAGKQDNWSTSSLLFWTPQGWKWNHKLSFLLKTPLLWTADADRPEEQFVCQHICSAEYLNHSEAQSLKAERDLTQHTEMSADKAVMLFYVSSPLWACSDRCSLFTFESIRDRSLCLTTTNLQLFFVGVFFTRNSLLISTEAAVVPCKSFCTSL